MTVSLADVGSSTGHPVVVFLGLGCVRYLVALYDELAEALGLRLLCIDRWGMGKTTQALENHRGFLEWAAVVEEVVDRLRIARFSILAHSAGAPYALAASLKLGDRVHGSVHLLAPWVSMTADGGINAGSYKWLKYVPNSMIQAAQAAEWKVTGWRLGKPPSIHLAPVGFDVRAPISSNDLPNVVLSDSDEDPVDQNPGHVLDHHNLHAPEGDSQPGEDFCPSSTSTLDERPSFESLQSDWSRLSHDTRGPSLSNHPLPITHHGKRFRNRSAGGRANGLLGKVLGNTKEATDYHHCRSQGIGTQPALEAKATGRKGPNRKPDHTQSSKTSPCPPTADGVPLRSTNSPRKRAMSTIYRKKPVAVPALPHVQTQTSDEQSHHQLQQRITPKALLGISLMRASHAESLKGGTQDLMAILEKNSKPWGFSYGDVYKDLKVWHGSKDEKISFRSSEWIAEVVNKGNVEVFIVEGGDHGLMTNFKVMVEVLESITEQWKTFKGLPRKGERGVP